ncbi:MAG: tetratricopeptide repeat protein, partial [Planctomycetota bacterium]
ESVAPQSTWVLSVLGRLLLQDDQLEEALSKYQSALELAPRNSVYMFYVAEVLAKLDRADEAEELRQKAIAIGLEPTQTLSQVTALAWNLLTAEDESLRDDEVALKMVMQAMNVSPQAKDGTRTLGIAHYRNDNWQEAKDALTASLKSRPDHGCEMFCLTMTEWQLGNKEKARQWYDEATAWMNQHQPHNAELIRFRDEAEELLQAARP